MQVPDASAVDSCCLLDVLEGGDFEAPRFILFGAKSDYYYYKLGMFILVWILHLLVQGYVVSNGDGVITTLYRL